MLIYSIKNDPARSQRLSPKFYCKEHCGNALLFLSETWCNATERIISDPLHEILSEVYPRKTYHEEGVSIGSFVKITRVYTLTLPPITGNDEIALRT